VTRDDEAGTMETIKTSIMFISPVGGIIQEVNGELDENPQLINV